jgi:hypothetical protein
MINVNITDESKIIANIAKIIGGIFLSSGA